MDEVSKCTLSKLSVWSLGFAFGVASAIYMLILGVVAWRFGLGAALVTTASSVYVGFAATPMGVVIGTLWGFVEGFVFGVISAFAYNFCLRHCHCHNCRKVETKV